MTAAQEVVEATGLGHGGTSVGHPPPWRSLRGRATLAFAALALALSATMAVAVWWAVSQYLMAQRESATLTQTVANADQVQRGLRTGGLSAPVLLAQLPREIGSTSLLVDDAEWFTTSLQLGRGDLPAALRAAVLSGQASRQRISVDGRTMLATGVPLAGLGDAYFEVYPLDDLDHTYLVLAVVLVAAGGAVPLVSLVLGRWVTRPAFRPLTRLTSAAGAMAAGDMDARIDPRGDPELVPLAASFNQTAEALAQRVRADARFAADVAHELRSPLTTMLSAVALVDSHRDSLPEDGREGLRLLSAEMDRFHRLVLDMLEISRTEAGTADVTMDDHCLADLVRSALPSPARSRLVIDPVAADLVVRTDKRRMERVVTNLVDNAEKHGHGLVRVSVTCTGAAAQVLIDDAGPGVAVEERHRIFERFARGRHTGRTSTEGVGLGLSLVLRQVRLLGGSVSVCDSPEAGARFVITLPVEERRCGA